MKKWILLILLLTVSCSGPESSGNPSEKKEEPKRVETRKEKGGTREVVTGLRVPWSLAVTKEHFYISERGGAIVEVSRPGGN